MERMGKKKASSLIKEFKKTLLRVLLPPKADLFPYFSFVLILGLVVLGWITIIIDSRMSPSIFTSDTLSRVQLFFGKLSGAESLERPAYSNWDSWKEALILARETVQMSVLAIGISGLGVAVTIVFASSNLVGRKNGAFVYGFGTVYFLFTKTTYLFSRAVPELVWALLVIFVLNPGILAGALALAIHNFGVLGRLNSEVVEDIDPAPMNSLRSSGAGNIQVFFFSVIPQVLPQFITFLLYRFEVIVRTSVVVGLVAVAGLGYKLRLDLAFFRYTDVALLLIIYVLVVWAVDALSIFMRKLAR